jgi:hypothetical protein
LTPQSGVGAAAPPVDQTEVSGKLNGLFEAAEPGDKVAINRARGHIIERVLQGEREVEVDLPDRLLVELRALRIEGLTISSPPKAVVPGDYPPPQPVVHIPEMKAPRRAVVRQPQRVRSEPEKKISAQIVKLGQGMPGYGGADRSEVIKLTCEAIAKQIGAVADGQAQEELQLEMAGALLQMVNVDPKRSSLVNNMFALYLPSLAAMNAPELEGQITQRIARLPNLQLGNLAAFSASLKRECRSIMDATGGVGDASQRLMLMGKLVNMLIQVFREKQNPDDFEQCMYLHGVVTEIIDGPKGGTGGLRQALEDIPANGRQSALHKAEFLNHMDPDEVSLHSKVPPPPPQSADGERVISQQELASLRASGLIS